ncbi:predicted protein [Sclerotinia sclerotiorum 1980 UF-70]|uniref:Uncharacterized protein n=1 Tax=Sclerotinia sclerotiorum (strain ATCC 18683 / 1980 / Ss-1) TaxID=665079 RepID=A7EN68_SCLS1|nr:predicted protein [Sclerotinia sclerotiorum 1980 UF-70]EDO04284.1 predicted protein [Sclerotinia sclerotiorum 1980 UF-70]
MRGMLRTSYFCYYIRLQTKFEADSKSRIFNIKTESTTCETGSKKAGLIMDKKW